MRLECQGDLTDEINACINDLIDIKQKAKVSLDFGNVKLVGEPVIKKLRTHDLLACQQSNLLVEPNIIVRYSSRAYVDGELIHSINYNRGSKKKSHFVCLKNKKIVEINNFIVISLNGKLECYLIGKYFRTNNNTSFIPGRRLEHTIQLLAKNNNFNAINATENQTKATIIENPVTHSLVATVPPNRVELLT